MDIKPEPYIQQFTTVKQVRIVPFVTVRAHGSNIPDAEKLLTELINEGWHIITSGAAGGDPGGEAGSPWANGFVILAREVVTNLMTIP
jgi:hypothetical protein